jgi:hypothetical protein
MTTVNITTSKIAITVPKPIVRSLSYPPSHLNGALSGVCGQIKPAFYQRQHDHNGCQ